MRWIYLCLPVALTLTGCGGKKNQKPPGLIVEPVLTTHGKIVRVNPTARFVIVNYPFGNVPEPDRRLQVYRAGLKVAEIKITGPRRDTNTVGDIVAGECQPGDEVRGD